MKLTSVLVIATLSVSATSAFGLNGASSIVQRAAAAPKAGFAKKPMVQAVDINGNRMDTMVSHIQILKFSRLRFYSNDKKRMSSYPMPRKIPSIRRQCACFFGKPMTGCGIVSIR